MRGLGGDLRAEGTPFAGAAGLGPREDALQSEGGKRQIGTRPQPRETAARPYPDRIRLRTLFGMGMQSAQQFDGLAFDVRGAVQQRRDIVIGMIRADGTGGQAGETGLAALRIEGGRLASRDGADGTCERSSEANRSAASSRLKSKPLWAW